MKGLFLFVVLVFVFLFSTFSVHAAVPYEAADVIGQDNFTSETTGLTSGKFAADVLVPLIDTTYHRLFVTDGDNNRVLVFNLDDDNDLVDKTADYVLGQSNFTSNSNGSTAGKLRIPSGLAYDPVNNLLFVDDSTYNCRVMVYNVSSITNGENAVNILGGTNINDIGICDTFQNSWIATSWAQGIAYDSETSFLYVPGGSRRVLVFNLSAGITDGMNASYVLGATTFTSNGSGATTSSTFDGDYISLAIDTSRKLLFLGDRFKNRVLVFDVNSISNGEPAINVLGQSIFTTATAATTQSGLGAPLGMGYDPTQKLLFVTQNTSNRISVFDTTSITDGESAVAVIGASDFTTVNAGSVSQTRIDINDRSDMAYDPTNRRMYYADDGNARILLFDFAHLPETITTPTLSTVYSQALNDYSQGTTTFSVSSGPLPTGLSLDTSTGVLSGTPTTAGSYSFTITHSDVNGSIGTYTDSQAYSFSLGSGGSSPSPEGNRSTTDTPTCNAQAPSVPELFQVTILGRTSANVHFAPASGPLNNYFISFGETKEAEGFSASLDMGHVDGAITYTLNFLKPNHPYYVKVHAGNGCMPGNWSKTIQFRTSTGLPYFP